MPATRLIVISDHRSDWCHTLQTLTTSQLLAEHDYAEISLSRPCVSKVSRM